MLPPVRTISGSSGSYQNSSSVSATVHLTGEPIFPGQAADADRDVNPNLAGKLNILLLNGRDSVSESLSMLAEALGRTIHLPRQEGEGPFAYAQRLADALRSLSPALRADVERQLNQILPGVRFALVIEALSNPAGPAAARIVALLEMAGLKERDLATRSVLTSYRQNGGVEVASELPIFQGPPTREDFVRLSSETVSPADFPEAGIAAAPPSPETDERIAQTGFTTGIDTDTASPKLEAIALPDETADTAALTRFHHESDNIFSRTSSTELDSPRAASDGVHGELDTESRADPAPLRGMAALREVKGITDARGLQSVLRTAFEAGESSDPVIQAKAAMQLLSGPDPAADSVVPVSVRHDGPVTKPFIDYTRPPPRPGPATDGFRPLEALKGWTADPVSGGLPILPASLEAEAALAAALSPHAGPEPDSEEAAFELRGRGVAANDSPSPSHKAALAAAEQQLLQNADEAAGLPVDRSAPRTPAREQSATEALLKAALQLSQDLRLAIPYVQHPYPLADERDGKEADRAGYRSQSGDAEDDGEEAEQQGSGQSGADDRAGAILETDPEADAETSALIADPAYDLYQRMAGWS